MNILLIGSGGREHAFAWKLTQSSLLSNLYIAPGNAGTAELGTNIAVSPHDFDAIKQAVLKYSISMVIVGPEDPLVHGIHDFFKTNTDIAHIPVIGPQKKAAQLEGSKQFAKEFMNRHGIPTAAHITVSPENIEEGFDFLTTQKPPYVLKADGLAGGKGVLILDSITEAKQELHNMLDGKFGDASKQVVIEECLHGIEMSIFVLTDGKDYVILPEAKDYKRIGEGDTGLNTGGMGAISPVPFASEKVLSAIEQDIIKPTIEGLQKDTIPYCGFIFFGLMVEDESAKVIEYNVRMGDPETEVVFPRIESDLLDLCIAASEEKLSEKSITLKPETAATVMLVAGGYPGRYEKGTQIKGLSNFSKSILFHAGTTHNNQNQIVTSGGRVIAVTSYGNTKEEALKHSYNTISHISFDKMNYRKDIGFDL
ncbi:MAG: phosphoribosylamine--glycine ligase [Bacteroidales bacterium]